MRSPTGAVVDRPARRRRGRDETTMLARRYREDGDLDARAALIESYLGLARSLARRFADRGEPLDDLVQVALIGLVKAVDRYDPESGNALVTYATPTILGELRRHFRDDWMIRVSRRKKDLLARLWPAMDRLSQQLGRAPTAPEIADAMGAPLDDVIEALDSARSYRPSSLDALTDDLDGPTERTIGVHDAGLDRVEDRAVLAPALAQLPPRIRHIVYLRFYRGLSQAEIGREVGVSQMHVSRLLTQALARVREALQG